MCWRGPGPAAVVRASEGLDYCWLCDCHGEAGNERIENISVPMYLSRLELMGAPAAGPKVRRAHYGLGRSNVSIDAGGASPWPTGRIRGSLVATGVEYRRLDLPRLSEFEGAGVYYAATDTETKLCINKEVVVVGAGNSAGQAIVALSRSARRVHVVARALDLGKSMSRYLVDRVENLDNAQIHRGAVVTTLEGDGHLQGIRIRDEAGVETRINTGAMFLVIGADPHTEWLDGCVQLDKKGFVVTGTSIPHDAVRGDLWRAQARTPFFLETSLPGVFAAGDVRSGSVKRCASAVGEGAMAVSFIHASLDAGSAAKSGPPPTT